MTFRDQAIADLPTFLDVGEFGDTVEVDGVAMACVLKDDETTRPEDGVSLLESTLYARMADFASIPVVRGRMKVGAREANITRVDEQQGMLAIRLQWFDS